MSGGNFKRRFRKERSNRDSFFRAGGADPGKAVCRGNGRIGDGAGGGTGCGMIRSSRGGAGSAGSGGGGGGRTGDDGLGGDDGLNWAGP